MGMMGENSNSLECVLHNILEAINKFDSSADENEKIALLGEVVNSVYCLADSDCVVTEENTAANKESIEFIKAFLLKHIAAIRRDITKFYAYNRIIDCVLDFSPEIINKAKRYKAQADRAVLTPDRGKISVIIPVYNVEKFLAKCLKSVLTQTYRNLEIILVDDGSPDYCGDICDEFALMDQRIKVVHKQNGGLCSARNAGLRMVTGDYIGFVDSDDWCSPDMYEYLLEGLLAYNTQVSVCRYYRVTSTSTHTTANGVDVVYDNHQEIMNEYINYFVVRSVVWNKLFKRELFEGKYFPEGRVYEGTYFVHEVMANVDRLVLLGEAKYYYFDNDNSIIRTRSLKNGMDYVFAYIKRYNDLCEKHPNLSDKLFDDAINAIRSLSYIGYKYKDSQISERVETIAAMQTFVENNEKRTSQLSSLIRQEIFALIKGTQRGFRKAKFIRAISSRVDELLKKIGKSPLKAGVAKKAPAKSAYYNEVPDLTAANLEILQKMQAVITEIMCEIDRICTKHGLRYYIYGGTLLGAVRHKGFIPWDDDADIVMPREDYEKFIKICTQELGDNYVLQNCFNTPDYHMLFSKVCKKGTYVHEEKWKSKNVNKGIFVDILPLDYFPRNMFFGKIVLHMVSILHQICAFNECHSERISARIIFALGKKLPRSMVYNMRDFVMKASNKYSNRENICSFGSHYKPMVRRVLKSDWFIGEEKRLEFEGHMFCAPADGEKYLVHLFGKNYMQLPPKEMRVCHTDFARLNFDGDTPPAKKKNLNKYY